VLLANGGHYISRKTPVADPDYLNAQSEEFLYADQIQKASSVPIMSSKGPEDPNMYIFALLEVTRS
jgi:hypothetical protein